MNHTLPGGHEFLNRNGQDLNHKGHKDHKGDESNKKHFVVLVPFVVEGLCSR
jgi:hypothetical protein